MAVSADWSRLPAECLSVGGDEHSVPVIRLMEADLQVQTASAGCLSPTSITLTHTHTCAGVGSYSKLLLLLVLCADTLIKHKWIVD